uniref:Uncharacterized protein n=1 Tax=Klebsiella pneumoniae TaxID=573 RepID=A0A8B0SS04_KLEPN|nr:hypothetical protein [Klebsiella pneumoniae]
MMANSIALAAARNFALLYSFYNGGIIHERLSRLISFFSLNPRILLWNSCASPYLQVPGKQIRNVHKHWEIMSEE